MEVKKREIDDHPSLPPVTHRNIEFKETECSTLLLTRK